MTEKYQHTSLGDVQDHVYIKATITAVDSANDTADIEGDGFSGSGVPIFYHCEPDSEHRSNGAIYGAASGFLVDDEVYVMCEGAAGSYTPVRIVGHVNGIKSCYPSRIIFFYAGYFVVAWDLIENKFPLVPKSLWDEELEQDYYTGEYVQPEDWPISNYVVIRKWYDECIDAEGENLLESEWVKSPAWCSPGFVTISGEWGGLAGTTWVQDYQWNAATRDQQGQSWPYPPAPDSANASSRVWNTIFGASSHETSGTHSEIAETGDNPPFTNRSKVLANNYSFTITEFSGMRFTAKNPGGGNYDFVRRLYKTGSSDIVSNDGDWVFTLVGFNTSHAYTQTCFKYITYTIPEIGGQPVFDIANIDYSDSHYWREYANPEDFWGPWLCDPCGRLPTPINNFITPTVPQRASVEQELDIVCETRDGGTSEFEEQRIMAVVYYEVSHFDPAEIIVGKGLYYKDENDPEQDWMVCLFVREMTELLPDCFNFEVFVGTGYAEGIASQAITNLTPQSDELTDVLEEMIHRQSQIGDKWRANPQFKVLKSQQLQYVD